MFLPPGAVILWVHQRTGFSAESYSDCPGQCTEKCPLGSEEPGDAEKMAEWADAVKDSRDKGGGFNIPQRDYLTVFFILFVFYSEMYMLEITEGLTDL